MTRSERTIAPKRPRATSGRTRKNRRSRAGTGRQRVEARGGGRSPGRISAAVLVGLGLALGSVFASASASTDRSWQGQPLGRGPTASKAGLSPQHGVTRSDRLVVKFVEGSEVRLRGGRLTSTTGAVDLDGLWRWLDAHPEVLVLRHFAREEAALDASRQNGQLRSGAPLADLNLYYQFRFDMGSSPGALAAALDELNAFSFIEAAFVEPVPSVAAIGDARRRPAVGSRASADDGRRTGGAAPVIAGRGGSGGSPDLPTPDFTSQQGYLFAPPNGINAQAVWGFPGGRGASLKILDIEGAWLFTHEDLRTPFFEGGPQVGDLGWRNHGTAVLGVMAGGLNGYGVTGIASDLQVGGVSIATMSVAAAIDLASANLDVGDLFLIELHAPGPNANGVGQFGYVPMEYWQDNFDAIQTAVAEGRICIEAGGNGQQDLDDPVYQGRFNREVRYSGAILVGAGTPSGNSAEWYTNYGSRADLNGWGSLVVTTGYGDLQGGSESQFYTGSFSGTSSASPIVSGAVASLQGMCRAHWNMNLSGPLAMRLLYDTGTPWDGTRRIGRRPDLLAARQLLLQGVGSVSGRVLDAQSGAVVAGAEIVFPQDDVFLRSDGNGQYAVTLLSGLHATEVRDFFHDPLQDPVTVVSGQNTVHDFLMVPRPVGSLEGTFLAQSTGQPIAGGTAFLLGTPIPPVTSGGSPDYSIAGIPAGTGYQALYGLIPGYGAATHVVEIVAGGVTVVDPVLANAQTFENGNGGYSGNAPWAWGAPSGPGPGGAFSGARLWATDLSGNYNDNVTAYLTVPTQNFSGATRLYLTFTHWYEIEGGFDGGNVQVRQGSNWITVAPAGGYPMAGLSGIAGQEGYSGSSGGWIPAVFDLTPYIGTSVQVRFHFGSDGGVTAPGWYIDDVAFDLGTAPAGAPDPNPSATADPRWIVRPNPFARTVEFGLLVSDPGRSDSGFPDPSLRDPGRSGPDRGGALAADRSAILARIFDPAGRQVRSLIPASRDAGRHTFVWDGRDDGGRDLPSGAYLCRIEIGGRTGGSQRLIRLAPPVVDR